MSKPRVRLTCFAVLSVVTLSPVGTPAGEGQASPTSSATTTTAGTRLWTQLFQEQTSFPAPAAIAFGPGGGRVFVTGGPRDDIGRATVALDATSGGVLWARRTQDPPGQVIAVSPNGTRVFVTGTAGGFGSATTSA